VELKNRGRQKKQGSEWEGGRKSEQVSGREGGRKSNEVGKRGTVGKRGIEKDLLIPPSQEKG